jgi:hypothetical protein
MPHPSYRPWYDSPNNVWWPVPVAAPTEILVSNPAGCMDVCLLWVLCVVQIEISATCWSLVQRSPTDCGASPCVI